MDLTKRTEIYTKLSAPFPDEAYGADTSRGTILTSLKAQYIVERLNEVLGLGNWRIEGDWKDVADGILFIGELTCQLDAETVISTGPVAGFGSDNLASSGDAYKSARTECMSKAASLLGIGNDMYKGKIAPRIDKAEVREEAPSEEKFKAKEEPAEKPQLRPARSFQRGARLMPRNAQKEASEDAAADDTSADSSN